MIGADAGFAAVLMEEILAPHVDFELTSRLILGSEWRTATDAQRERFVSAYRASMLRTYSRLLADNVDAVFERAREGTEVLRMQPSVPNKSDPNRMTVRTLMLLGGGRTAPVDYEMRRSGAGWRVYDIRVEGLSLVINHRTEYRAVLDRSTLDELIERMEAANGRVARSG